MTASSVIGSGPVSILTALGVQHGIPLSLLAIKDGTIDASRLDPAIAADAAPVFRALLQSGALVAGPSGAPVLALTLKAKMPGSAGNAISVAFANVTPDQAVPGNTTVDVTLNFAEHRRGLTQASIGTQLGTPAGGTAPGLVALTAAATALPDPLAATALAGSPLTLTVPGGGGTAFAVTAVGADPALADLTVAIEDVDAGAGTFTLVTALGHHAAGVKLSDLAATIGLLVDVTTGLGGFAPPVEGTVTLSGGTDAATTPAKAAEATILSE